MNSALRQITSKAKRDDYAVPLQAADFRSGGLPQESYVRPNRLFTADSKVVLYKAGGLERTKTDEVIARLIEILKS